jgi:hypothetical protein
MMRVSPVVTARTRRKNFLVCSKPCLRRAHTPAFIPELIANKQMTRMTANSLVTVLIRIKIRSLKTVKGAFAPNIPQRPQPLGLPLRVGSTVPFHTKAVNTLF